MNKITIEEFNRIKKELAEIAKKAENIETEEEIEAFIKEYIDKERELANYDLSDIPFEAWEDIIIMSFEDNPLDLSKTKANIDFKKVEYSGNANLKGCNVRNLDSLTKNGALIESDFDEKVVEEHPDLFLSKSFDEDFKKKYYAHTLEISDLEHLTTDQIDELDKKSITAHIKSDRKITYLVQKFGLPVVIELYNLSKQDFEIVYELLDAYRLTSFFDHGDVLTHDELIEKLKTTEPSKYKEVCLEEMKNLFINSHLLPSIERLPKVFEEEYPNLFLKDLDLPDDVKQRYFSRDLTIQDIIDYHEQFKDIPIDFFMGSATYIPKTIRERFGAGKFQELVAKHPDVFSHFTDSMMLYEFNQDLERVIIPDDLDRSFFIAVKDYFTSSYVPFIRYEDEDQQEIMPDWVKSMGFTLKRELKTNNELLNLDERTILVNTDQMKVINALGIDNIKSFEEETGFFTHKGYAWSKELEMFNAILTFISNHKSVSEMNKAGIDFKFGSLSYSEFLDQFAKLLDVMKKENIFYEFPDYDWIKGDFRSSHPEIFMSENAPAELKEAFYKNRVYPRILFDHKEYIQFLVDKNLLTTLNLNMKLAVPSPAGQDGKVFITYNNFIDSYISRYGNEKLLLLVSKYGGILSDLEIDSFHGEIDNEESIEKSLRHAIYKKIISTKPEYSYLQGIPELVSEYPDIFVDFKVLSNVSDEEKHRLATAFYSGKLSFADIRLYPQLAQILKDKNLEIAFGEEDKAFANGRITFRSNGGSQTVYSDLELLRIFGNEKFLELCSMYGRYMEGMATYLGKDFDFSQGSISFSDITKKIESIIERECIAGTMQYSPDDAPDFLRETHKELFLSPDAPKDLQRYFYNYSNNYPMTFELLEAHKEWLPFLEGKAITTALLRNGALRNDLIKYFQLFGEEKGIRLGISRGRNVHEMIKSHQVELMKSWYDKTGGKFIPHFVVMQNFRIDEADKFLASASNWSTLMRIQSFSKSPESVDAMLKLAYSFGAFDHDQRGFKELVDLLTCLPKKIDAENAYIIDQIDDKIDIYSQRGVAFHNIGIIDADGKARTEAPDMTPEEKEESYNKMIDYLKHVQFIDDPFDNNSLLALMETLKKENVPIDFSKPIFSQMYRKNEDGSLSLVINSQSYPKSSQIIRMVLEQYRRLPILTPDKAHKLFGGFELKYDPDFREFLLANLDNIINNPDYINLVASVQRQFSNIKAVNSNRVLTWELAVSYVQENRYTSVNVGNERVAEISAIAGYSQADFNTLQQIYNYGKQRTFSSIPRIEKTAEKVSGNYTYETLRLDDPLAMAIGTLTDCCQELGNCAEVCMEHSMVDKNGRVFVIKDDKGNVVAQSWVWRNGNVLCFDNIEIPEKAFVRAAKEHPELGRKGFTDDIYEIYKQAAHDLIEADERVYKELLDSGKISQEQYDGLRLGKVTVGLGYNDIADSLKQNAQSDKGTVSRPLPFEEPVRLHRGLYTNDSVTQYILEEREGREDYRGDTLSVHSDDYVECSDENFTEKKLLSLQKLEIVTKGDIRNLETILNSYADMEHPLKELARNYGLNPETARVVMNPNFAIIYDVNGNKLRIADLLFNTRVDNETQQLDIESKVVMQIRLALDQISSGKEVDVSSLDEKQMNMYLKAKGLSSEIDEERGVGNAR